MKNERVSEQLVLKDGTVCCIIAEGAPGTLIISHLQKVMQISAIPSDETKRERTPSHPYLRRLLIVVDFHSTGMPISKCIQEILPSQDNINQTGFAAGEVSSSIRNSEIKYVFCRPGDENTLAPQLKVSMIIAQYSQRYNALLLHGALAEIDDCGVILAGEGGAGKSTASNRLPLPWHSLCDDATLVVRDPQGKYWAHPWPTWSKLLSGEPHVSWDVQRAVPLAGIFFLSRSQRIQIDPVGSGKAACMLAESAEQTSISIPHMTDQDDLRAHRLERFENACLLARSVPCYALNLNLCDPFWHEIEQTIGCQVENAKY